MLKLMKNFCQNDEGLELVEWAIVAAMITAAVATTMQTIGTQTDTALTTLQNNMTP